MDKSLNYPGVDHSACIQRLLQWRKDILLRVKRWRAARRDIEILGNLSDEALKDIGVSRSDLMSIETGDFLTDASRRKRWR